LAWLYLMINKNSISFYNRDEIVEATISSYVYESILPT